jgi:hypothetical protein
VATEFAPSIPWFDWEPYQGPTLSELRILVPPAMVRLKHWLEFCIPWYIGTMIQETGILVERVQTGVRMEKRLLKVLKAFAEYHDLTLGDLLEGIVLHAFDGKTPFSQDSLDRIKALKRFYGLRLDSRASHRLKEKGLEPRRPRRKLRS